jgi:hypothetical protein
MEPGVTEVRRDEHGRFCKPHFEEQRCNRCDVLRDGAPVKSSVVVVAKDGTVESERHEERAQGDEEASETAQDAV